ncbi:MAG: hypothetical protein J0H62_06395 [Rhizobiales bacterium]|nr:hypothetical protein [Hyphomicrobiales bacterium]
MEIKAVSRGLSLFAIALCTLVTGGCVALIAFLISLHQGTDPASILATFTVAAVPAACAAWMVASIRVCLQVYLQHPHFRIAVAPGVLTIANRHDTLTVKASDVAAYYVYNNKIRLLLRAELRPRDLRPFASLRGRYLTISLSRLDGHIPVAEWLHRFDGDVAVKSKVGPGMIAQALGYGLS